MSFKHPNRHPIIFQTVKRKNKKSCDRTYLRKCLVCWVLQLKNHNWISGFLALLPFVRPPAYVNVFNLNVCSKETTKDGWKKMRRWRVNAAENYRPMEKGWETGGVRGRGSGGATILFPSVRLFSQFVSCALRPPRMMSSFPSTARKVE